MSSLFLDTSNKIVYGLLSDDFEWITLKSVQEKKASRALHALVFECLEENSSDIKDLNHVFTLSGPGSYTGVRLAQGFVEVLEWQGFDAFSCRHFDIPRLLGVSQGAFISRAFKQEAFIYQWEGSNQQQRLEPEINAARQIKELLKKGVPCFTSEPGLYNECVSTYDLLEKEPKNLFSLLKANKVKSEVFYYRNLEQEFQKEKKKT
ncbi:MAG: hypothetical protein WEB87_01795 [Bacteriovoracaceae bacterium]